MIASHLVFAIGIRIPSLEGQIGFEKALASPFYLHKPRPESWQYYHGYLATATIS